MKQGKPRNEDTLAPVALFWCQEQWQSSQTSASLLPPEDECEAAPQTEPATRGTCERSDANW